MGQRVLVRRRGGCAASSAHQAPFLQDTPECPSAANGTATIRPGEVRRLSSDAELGITEDAADDGSDHAGRAPERMVPEVLRAVEKAAASMGGDSEAQHHHITPHPVHTVPVPGWPALKPKLAAASVLLPISVPVLPRSPSGPPVPAPKFVGPTTVRILGGDKNEELIASVMLRPWSTASQDVSPTAAAGHRDWFGSASPPGPGPPRASKASPPHNGARPAVHGAMFVERSAPPTVTVSAAPIVERPAGLRRAVHACRKAQPRYDVCAAPPRPASARSRREAGGTIRERPLSGRPRGIMLPSKLPGPADRS